MDNVQVIAIIEKLLDDGAITIAGLEAAIQLAPYLGDLRARSATALKHAQLDRDAGHPHTLLISFDKAGHPVMEIRYGTEDVQAMPLHQGKAMART